MPLMSDGFKARLAEARAVKPEDDPLSTCPGCVGFSRTEGCCGAYCSDTEDEDEGYDPPWGEQQSQVDWLESRFDIPEASDMEDDWYDIGEDM